MSRTVVFVPTCNAGTRWPAFLQGLKAQQAAAARCVVIDSESDDGTAEQAQAAGLPVHTIERRSFNHGATRQLAIDRFAGDADVAVFLTQDAVLARPDALGALLSAFQDPLVAAAYGRQLPHPDAGPVAAHARLFNYPAESHTRTLADVARFGIKTCFMSNSFAAYRLSALRQASGFAGDLILGEDTHLAARLLQRGHSIAYQAQACVYHSHDHTLFEEFQRYFDTGVFHAREAALLQAFGGAGREGLRFVRSELMYLLRRAPWRLPEAACRTLLKALAYRLGRSHSRLPRSMRQPLSMHKGFWA
jgi:rhamnosyltransferase